MIHPVYSLKITLAESQQDSVVCSNWYGSWEQLSFGGVQHAVPDARDLCWTNLSIWQGDHRNEFALPPPCFISVDFFSRGGSRDQPLCLMACLVLFSGWLASSRKAGKLRKVPWVFPFINAEISGLTAAGPNPSTSLVTGRAQVCFSMDNQVHEWCAFTLGGAGTSKYRIEKWVWEGS